jgi:hypothetical protein
MKRIFLFCSALVICAVTLGQSPLDKKSYKVTKTANPPTIDGVINADEWAPGDWNGDFIQYQPDDGKPATQKTEFKILFDENNVYVAIKAYDTSPDSIVRRVTRRDNIDGDFVGVAFDSYHDLRTAFVFFVNAAGAKTDEIISNDGDNEDTTWDPIWLTKTAVYDWGYAAELRIPLTQLRFRISEGGTWGMTVMRMLYRNQEQAFWSYIPRNSAGFIHYFGNANGFEGISPKKQADITPFAVGSFEHNGKEEGNPFATGKKYNLNGGIDGKFGITNNMTLDLTINPDFGQVEADPSEVNLTAFETFFTEKRPFFVEGKNITSFSVGIGDGDLGNDNLFYTRRIGRSPHLDANTETNEYAKIPRSTSIIGATKLTGKTADGLSIGIIDALTSAEKAEIDSLGKRSYQTVEPLTNYFVSRVMKDFNKGNTLIGGGFTNTHRFFDDTGINSLVTSANTGGIDFTQFFNDKNWFLSATAAFSMLSGSTESVENLQTSSVHYYQRPDAKYVDVDPTRKSLGGYGGNVQFGKTGGNWKFALFGLWKSPGFDLNDVGYLRRADDLSLIAWSSYLFNKPFSIFREIRFNANEWNNWDWGGTFLDVGGNLSVSFKFKNLWYLGVGTNINSTEISNTMLRGGPSMKSPASYNYWVYANTNESKKVYFETNYYITTAAEGAYRYTGGEIDAFFRPGKAFSVTLAPSVSKSFNQTQYVTNTDMEGNPRYILAKIDQTILMMSLRLSFNVTPELTLQYWGQPFLATMDYSDYKMVTSPRANKFEDRFHTFNNSEIAYNAVDNEYSVDENVDGTIDYKFSNPSCNYDQFLSNFVVRWEYRPGSTLFLVWSQTRDYYIPNGEYSFNNNFTNLFSENTPDDIFLIKFTYRFGLR